MDEQIDIPESLYQDEAVVFLADRYHTTTHEIVQCFLLRNQKEGGGEQKLSDFILEDNELELLRGLINMAYSPKQK